MILFLENIPSKIWPSKGAIEFRNLSLRYSEDDPAVLKDINVIIAPEEKVLKIHIFLVITNPIFQKTVVI